MDPFITAFNALASAAITLAVSWAIVSHQVRDRVLIKVGLILLAVGTATSSWHLAAGLSLHNLEGVNRAHALVLMGLLVCVVGYWLRLRAGETLGDIVVVPGVCPPDCTGSSSHPST